MTENNSIAWHPLPRGEGTNNFHYFALLVGMPAEAFDSRLIDRYRTDGYFVVRKLLSEVEVQQICDRISYIVEIGQDH